MGDPLPHPRKGLWIREGGTDEGLRPPPGARLALGWCPPPCPRRVSPVSPRVLSVPPLALALGLGSIFCKDVTDVRPCINKLFLAIPAGPAAFGGARGGGWCPCVPFVSLFLSPGPLFLSLFPAVSPQFLPPPQEVQGGAGAGPLCHLPGPGVALCPPPPAGLGAGLGSGALFGSELRAGVAPQCPRAGAVPVSPALPRGGSLAWSPRGWAQLGQGGFGGHLAQVTASTNRDNDSVWGKEGRH